MFVVCWCEWDSWEFVGLFSTKRRAQGYIKKFPKHYAEQCEIIDADLNAPHVEPPTLIKSRMKKRSAAARELGTPKYRQRVIPNKKRKALKRACRTKQCC